MATRGFSHTPAILQAASRLTLSILISKLRVWLEAAINLVTCFLDLYVVFIIFIFISAGEPLKTLFFIFPPVVFLVAEGLSNTVHRFTKGNGHLFVFATILVLPRGDWTQGGCPPVRLAIIRFIIILLISCFISLLVSYYSGCRWSVQCRHRCC